jgi:hypothetical protein
MENYCAFSKKHKCVKWMDYELTRHEEPSKTMLFFEPAPQTVPSKRLANPQKL